LIDFKKKLKSIVEEHGTSIIFDSEACERLLAEHLSKQKAAQNILLIAQKEGIPQILHRSGNKSYVALQIKMKKALDDRFNLPDNMVLLPNLLDLQLIHGHMPWIYLFRGTKIEVNLIKIILSSMFIHN